MHVRTASLLAEGLRLYRVLPTESVDGAQDTAQGGAAEENWESIVCVGDAPSGLIGPWHFDKVVSARDGSEMMGEDEIEALRQARAAKAAEVVKAAQARADAEEARRKQREASRRQREESEAMAAPVQAPRHNPYLAHMAAPEEEDDDDE